MLVEQCYECYNSNDTTEGELALDSRQGVLAGGEGGGDRRARPFKTPPLAVEKIRQSLEKCRAVFVDNIFFREFSRVSQACFCQRFHFEFISNSDKDTVKIVAEYEKLIVWASGDPSDRG